MPLTAEERKARAEKRAADISELDKLRVEDSVRGRFADLFADEFESLPPGTLIQLATAATVVHQQVLGEISQVEVVGAHVAIEHTGYPNGTVHTDAAGNLVEVSFADPVMVF